MVAARTRRGALLAPYVPSPSFDSPVLPGGLSPPPQRRPPPGAIGLTPGGDRSEWALLREVPRISQRRTPASCILLQSHQQRKGERGYRRSGWMEKNLRRGGMRVLGGSYGSDYSVPVSGVWSPGIIARKAAGREEDGGLTDWSRLHAGRLPFSLRRPYS